MKFPDALEQQLQEAEGILGSKGGQHAGTPRLRELRWSIESLWRALEASVKLQSHYADLLNMHDGGARIGFKNAQAWIDRLKEIGDI